MSNQPNDSSPQIIDPDSALSNSEHLTRPQVLSRRSRKLHQLTKLYKTQYWALMEQLKNQYTDYYWHYGKSPFVENNDDVAAAANSNFGECDNRCEVEGCEMKAMQLTRNCSMHILRDEKQVLYKGCVYVVKSSPAGPILCSKPILRAAVPSFCTTHMQKAEKNVAMALKKAGLSGHSTNKLAPQFHVIVAEYVKQIQAKRRVAREVKKEPCEVRKEPCMPGHIEYFGN